MPYFVVKVLSHPATGKDTITCCARADTLPVALTQFAQLCHDDYPKEYAVCAEGFFPYQPLVSAVCDLTTMMVLHMPHYVPISTTAPESYDYGFCLKLPSDDLGSVRVVWVPQDMAEYQMGRYASGLYQTGLYYFPPRA